MFENASEITICRQSLSARKNLILIRAGSKPRPSFFSRELAAERNYDVAINYYSSPHEDDAVYRGADAIFGGGLSKLHGAKLYFAKTGLNQIYNNCLFLDDDVELLFDPERLFALCEEYSLDLAQAALAPDCKDAMGLTRQHPGLKYRHTNFVEVMAPVLSRNFLQEMLPSFDLSISGWGIDVYWGHSLGTRWTAGIIDDLLMRHTVPSDHANGGFYRYLSTLGINPYAELRAVLDKIGVNPYCAQSIGYFPHSYYFRA